MRNYFTYIEHLLHKITFIFAHIQILSTTSHGVIQVHKYVLHQIYYNNWSKNVSVSVFKLHNYITISKLDAVY